MPAGHAGRAPLAWLDHLPLYALSPSGPRPCLTEHGRQGRTTGHRPPHPVAMAAHGRIKGGVRCTGQESRPERGWGGTEAGVALRSSRGCRGSSGTAALGQKACCKWKSAAVWRVQAFLLGSWTPHQGGAPTVSVERAATALVSDAFAAGPALPLCTRLAMHGLTVLTRPTTAFWLAVPCRGQQLMGPGTCHLLGEPCHLLPCLLSRTEGKRQRTCQGQEGPTD